MDLKKKHVRIVTDIKYGFVKLVVIFFFTFILLPNKLRQQSWLEIFFTKLLEIYKIIQMSHFHSFRMHYQKQIFFHVELLQVSVDFSNLRLNLPLRVIKLEIHKIM